MTIIVTGLETIEVTDPKGVCRNPVTTPPVGQTPSPRGVDNIRRDIASPAINIPTPPIPGAYHRQWDSLADAGGNREKWQRGLNSGIGDFNGITRTAIEQADLKRKFDGNGSSGTTPNKFES